MYSGSNQTWLLCQKRRLKRFAVEERTFKKWHCGIWAAAQ